MIPTAAAVNGPIRTAPARDAADEQRQARDENRRDRQPCTGTSAAIVVPTATTTQPNHREASQDDRKHHPQVTGEGA